MNLEQETRDLMADWFEKRSNTLRKLSQGAGVPFYWLQSFKRYPKANAGVKHVQALYDYLNGNG
jgi:hypothetical protein